MAYHREVIIKAERMYSNLGSNPNVYSFPQPSQPPNYPNIAECYRTVKERAVVKRMVRLRHGWCKLACDSPSSRTAWCGNSNCSSNSRLPT